MTGDLRRYAAVNARVRAMIPLLLGRGGLEALYRAEIRERRSDAALRSAEPRVANAGRDILALLPDPERGFVRQFLLRREVEGLKLVLRAVHHGWRWEDVAPFAPSLAGVSTVDLRSLAATHDLRELGDRLRRTPYAAALAGARHRVAGEGTFAAEVALELDYYERLWAAAGSLRPSDTERARLLLGTLFDILNLGWIARYREAPALSSVEILNYTLRQGRWLKIARRRELADGARPWEAILAGTPLGPLFAGSGEKRFDSISPSLWRLLCAETRRALAGYPFHIGVPLAFLIERDIESRDTSALRAAGTINLPAADALDRMATLRA